MIKLIITNPTGIVRNRSALLDSKCYIMLSKKGGSLTKKQYQKFIDLAASKQKVEIIAYLLEYKTTLKKTTRHLRFVGAWLFF